MIRNMGRALMLDVDFYSHVARTPVLFWQAAAVVTFANMFAGIGSSIATGSDPLVGGAVGVATGVSGWVVWSGVAYLVGVRVFGGDTSYRAMLRVVGFAYAPLTFGVVPWLGFVGAAWALLAAVVAIHESMAFSTRRSFATMAPGWVVWLGLAVGINVALGWDFFSTWRV
ncbi:MAG: YIP1 family protein [Actinomycetota bacterium]|nr:YIP1 family protein [Actinomycetota bacterium]